MNSLDRRTVYRTQNELHGELSSKMMMMMMTMMMDSETEPVITKRRDRISEEASWSPNTAGVQQSNNGARKTAKNTEPVYAVENEGGSNISKRSENNESFNNSTEPKSKKHYPWYYYLFDDPDSPSYQQEVRNSIFMISCIVVLFGLVLIPMGTRLFYDFCIDGNEASKAGWRRPIYETETTDASETKQSFLVYKAVIFHPPGSSTSALTPPETMASFTPTITCPTYTDSKDQADIGKITGGADEKK